MRSEVAVGAAISRLFVGHLGEIATQVLSWASAAGGSGSKKPLSHGGRRSPLPLHTWSEVAVAGVITCSSPAQGLTGWQAPLRRYVLAGQVEHSVSEVAVPTRVTYWLARQLRCGVQTPSASPAQTLTCQLPAGHERHPVHWRSDVRVAARVSNWPWVHVVSGTHMCVFIKPLGL
jgi:hypothetical protein